MKIENDHDNVEYKLTHLVNLVDEVCKNYGYVDESEHASMLLALDRDMIQVANKIEEVRQNLYKKFVDPYKIDYEEWKNTIDKKIGRLENLLTLTHLEDDKAILKTPDDIVKDEDERYKGVTYTRVYDTEVSARVRISLIRSRVNIYKDIINGLHAISDTLNGINKDKEILLKNKDVRRNHFKTLFKNFMVSDEWEDVKAAFKRKVRHYVAGHIDKEEGYQLMFEEHEDIYKDDIRSQLCCAYLDEIDIPSFIIKNRDAISEADVKSLFVYILAHQMLQVKVQSFEALKAPDAEHNKLFINQGAQELIETMIPLFSKHVYFENSYQYTALYLAILDMGLMPQGGSNAPQFVKFINRHFKVDIKSNDTITKCTGPLLGHSFGRITQGEYRGTNMDDAKFNAIRNEYHICLSIINKIMKINLAEEGFAEDVWQEHQDAPSFIEYDNVERLILLRDILKGKHTEI